MAKSATLKHLSTLVLQTDQKGVLIRRIEPTAPVSKSLKKGDILLSFDGVDIANDGTVPFRSGERISFNYLVSRKYTNEQVFFCGRCWSFVQHMGHMLDYPKLLSTMNKEPFFLSRYLFLTEARPCRTNLSGFCL